LAHSESHRGFRLLYWRSVFRNGAGVRPREASGKLQLHERAGGADSERSHSLLPAGDPTGGAAALHGDSPLPGSKSRGAASSSPNQDTYGACSIRSGSKSCGASSFSLNHDTYSACGVRSRSTNPPASSLSSNHHTYHPPP